MKYKKKKILIVQPLIPHYRLGFFEELNKSFELDLFAKYNSKEKYNFKIIPSTTYKIFNTFYWQENLLKVNFEKYALVIFNVNLRYLSTVLALIKCKKNSIPTIDFNHKRSSTSKTIFIFLRDIFLKFFTNGKIFYMKNEYQENLNKKIFNCIRPYNLGYANNSIDTYAISKLRKKYVAKERVDFIYIGRVTSKANLKLLILALNYSKKNYKVNIVGDYKNNSNSLKEIIDKYNLNKRVKWYKFSKNELEISQIFNKCRCFVYPGEVGLSIIHAMSYGLPSIIHNNNRHHNPENYAFSDGYNGITFKENNPKSLAKKMDHLYSLTDKELEKYSENCLKKINDNFSIQLMAQNFKKSINKLI